MNDQPTIKLPKMRIEENVVVPLAVYQQLVDRCARERLNLQISNGSAFHARILITKLFEIAQEEVQIVSGRLTDTSRKGIDVYGYETVIAAAKKFLANPGTVLSILVQMGSIDRGQQNRLLNALITDPKRNGSLQIFIPKSNIFDESLPHFMVADRSGYRLETGKDASPEEEAIKAIANFGDPKSGKALSALFDELNSVLEEMKESCEMHVYEPGYNTNLLA